MSTAVENALIMTAFLAAGVLLLVSMVGHLRKVRRITEDGTVPSPPTADGSAESGVPPDGSGSSHDGEPPYGEPPYGTDAERAEGR